MLRGVEKLRRQRHRRSRCLRMEDRLSGYVLPGIHRQAVLRTSRALESYGPPMLPVGQHCLANGGAQNFVLHFEGEQLAEFAGSELATLSAAHLDVLIGFASGVVGLVAQVNRDPPVGVAKAAQASRVVPVGVARAMQ